MATERQISINIRAITGELTAGLNKAKSDTQAWGASTQATIGQVEQSTERMARLWRSAFEAFLGFEVIKGLKGIALGADQAATQLDVAQRIAKNFGNALDPAKMEAWLQAFAMSPKGGGYPIDEMRKAVQLFASLGEGPAQIQRAIADTAEVAAAKEIDFAEAANIVRMALTGHIEMLTRYGYISREAAKHIHTVEQAMRAIETGTSGAAEQRANKLAGDFGRLGTAASLLADKLGAALAPFFDAMANALTNLAEAFGKIPEPVMKVVGNMLAFGSSLVAVTLFLPAIAKGIAIMGEGLRLLGVLVLPLITFVQRLAATFGLASTAMEGFTASELLATGPIAAIIVAIGGVTVAVVEMTKHMDHVKSAWHDWTQYLSDSFSEFVNNFEHDSGTLVRTMNSIAKLALDTMTLQVGKWKGDLGNIIMTAAPRSLIKDAPGLAKDDSNIGADIVGDWKKIGTTVLDYFQHLFTTSLGKSPDTHRNAAFPGLIPGKSGGGKDTGPAAAADALKNAEEAVKEAIAALANRVADARHNVEKSTTAVDQYKAGLPGGQPQNAAQQAELQKLITNELKAQQALHDRLQEQQQAELAAASGFDQYAAKISTHLKNHDELVRQAKDAALEHVRAAQQLGEEYLRIGVTVAQLKNDIRSSFEGMVEKAREAGDAAADALYDQQRIQNEADQAAIQQQIDMLPYGGAGAISFSGPAQGPHERDARAAAETESMHPGSKNANVEADRLRVALAALGVAIAQDAEDEKAKHVANAQNAYDTLKTSQALKDLTDAQNAYAQSVVDTAKAQDAYVLATQKLIIDQQQKWDQLINGLVEKVGAPGLSANAQTGAISFDPMTFLFAAIEQSQVFGNVMSTVTQIVQVFAEMLDALRPVIDALLQVVKAVANVFIFLYNMVARILDLFGLQIQQLNYLNSAIGGLVPLLQIWHEIPTLNELAAGKLNSPLSTTPQSYGALPGTQGAGQNTLMKVVEILTGIFGAIVVEKMFSGLNFQQAVHATAQLIGINASTKQIPITDTANTAKINMQAASDALKQSGLAMNANTLLSEIWQTLQQMLAQQQAASGGGGIFGALLSLAGGLGGLGGAPGAGFGGAGSGGHGGPMALLGGMGNAMQDVARGARAVASALTEHVVQLRNATSALSLFTNAVSDAGRSATRFGGSLSIPALSNALALDTDRRYASSSYGINRVPI